MDVGEISGPMPIVMHNGAEVFECPCGERIWRIECYPPKSNIHYSMLQKYIKHYCKTKLISKQTNCGIPIQCYVGE
jgi:hypothetical protein